VNLASSLARLDTTVNGQLIGGPTVLQRTTSSAAAEGARQSDQGGMGALGIRDDTWRVRGFVIAHSGRNCDGKENAKMNLSYADATAFMEKQPEKTVFVVQVDGETHSGETGGHWFNLTYGRRS
jgi:hypothetical protein